MLGLWWYKPLKSWLSDHCKPTQQTGRWTGNEITNYRRQHLYPTKEKRKKNEKEKEENKKKEKKHKKMVKTLNSAVKIRTLVLKEEATLAGTHVFNALKYLDKMPNIAKNKV